MAHNSPSQIRFTDVSICNIITCLQIRYSVNWCKNYHVIITSQNLSKQLHLLKAPNHNHPVLISLYSVYWILDNHNCLLFIVSSNTCKVKHTHQPQDVPGQLLRLDRSTPKRLIPPRKKTLLNLLISHVQ